MSRRAVLVCPGRGTYNKAELGYLGHHHRDQSALFAEFDALRRGAGQETLADLDGAARFSNARHTRGDTASALIYAASLADARALDPGIDICAVTGNSMGWYIALAAAGAVRPVDGFNVVNTMGTLMQDSLIGGQIIYPVVGADWRPDPARRAAVMTVMQDIDAQAAQTLRLSIDLGGMLVLAGDAAGRAAFEARMPRIEDRFPMRLPNHAAFHTELQTPIATAGQGALGQDMFGTPDRPMIDGRGQIWWPGASDPVALRDYTLSHQVTRPYDFARAIQTAAREFAPDLFIVTGPGTTLGSAVAQSLIAIDWKGMCDKATFQQMQQDTPVLVSMGREDQRASVLPAGAG